MSKLKHIKPMSEDASVQSDPFYGNDIFKIRYRQLTDMSNKRTPDSIDKPENDVLDDFQDGDTVTGMGLKKDEEYTGEVVAIEKDSKGENIGIKIETDGEIIELKPSTVKLADNGKAGNRKDNIGQPGVNTAYQGQDDTFQPMTYEGKKLNSIKSFSEFNGRNSK